MRFHAFRKDISPKVNVIAQLEFELAYYDVTAKHVSRYATMSSFSPIVGNSHGDSSSNPGQCCLHFT